MDFRTIIKQNFGVDLPISSGFGSDFTTAVVVLPTAPNFAYADIESDYLKYMGLLRNIEWKIISKTLINNGGKTFDVVKVETKEIAGKNNSICTEINYFDVTACKIV